MPRSEVAPVMTAVRCVLDMSCSWISNQFADQVARSGGGRGSFVIGNVAGFELQREVTRIAGIGKGFQAAREVDLAVADGQVDVAGYGVTDVDVRDLRPEPVDELDRIAAGGDNMAEIHHDADPA